MPILRETTIDTLMSLGAPASPKLIARATTALGLGDLVPARLGSMRRDEERSYRSRPGGRPVYVCAALTQDGVHARGYLALSTWPLSQRLLTEHAPLMWRLRHAACVADRVARLGRRPGPMSDLLDDLVAVVPGLPPGATPETVAEVAEEERARLAALFRPPEPELDHVQTLFGR